MTSDKYPGWIFEKDGNNYFGSKKGYLYAVMVYPFKGSFTAEIMTLQKRCDGSTKWDAAHRNPYEGTPAEVIAEIEKRHAYHNCAA